MSTAQDAVPLVAGTPIGGYVIERVVAVDRYGFSYLAQDDARRECLIREFLPLEFAERAEGGVRPREADDRNALRFWLRSFLERSAQVSRLVHPCLPRIRKQFEADGTAYEVSDFHPGETLQSLLDTDGTLPEPALLRVLDGVLGALEVAHASGILHRDLCPQHIWLRDSDGTPCLREFGVLRAPMRLKQRTIHGCPEPPYAAPEADQPAATQTAAADLYAVGVIAWRALTGVLPPSAAERRKGAALPPLSTAARVRCSTELEEAVVAALRLVPDQRPKSVVEWRRMLPIIPAAQNPSPPAASGVRDRPRVVPTASSSSGTGRPRWLLPAAATAIVALLGYLLLPSHKPVAAPAAPTTAAAPSPVTPAASGPAPAPAEAAAPAPAADSSGSSLDQLALDLIQRERKLQEARDAQRIEQEKSAAELKAAKEAQTAKPNNGALPTTVISPPSGPSPQALEAEARTRALEQEVAKLRAESESRQKAEDETAKQRALAVAEKEAAAQAAEADRVRQAQAIALARKTCELPAMDLSEGGNLNYYNAMSAPGARKTPTGAIRLPPVEFSDGKSAVYEITPDSCAHRVR